jgi:predicted Fe-Mo cluster-binding NifX family protein
MSNIALPSIGEGGLKGVLSLRFGRSDNIIIVSLKEKSIEAVKVIPIQKNKALGNLGMYIANTILENSASDVIVSFIGSKAFQTLSSKMVKIFQVATKDLVIKQCIELFIQDKLPLLKEPNAHLIKE